MNAKTQQINKLINSLNNFIKIDGINILSESFENITIGISGNESVLRKVQEIYSSFTDIKTDDFLRDSNEDNNSITFEEVESNIQANYYDFNWQISISKINWFKFDSTTVTAFFDINNLNTWINSLDAFSSNNEFLKYESIQIIVPELDSGNIEGNNFIITKEIVDSYEFKCDIILPTNETIKKFVHVISNDSIIFEPSNFFFKINSIDIEIEKNLLNKYFELLGVSLVSIFYSRDNIEIKGLTHNKTLFKTNKLIDLNNIRDLEEAVKWAYEENTTTRLQLLADRLCFHSHNEISLNDLLINNINEALREAKDRYKFVITEKSEEYTKDLRDLLKDTKDKADKYSEKTRNVINSLLRDILGSIFFLGLTLYSRFSQNENFILSNDAELIFSLLGGYFLISMLLQSSFNFWDINLSKKEACKWSENSMDYMIKDTYTKYVTEPLNIRTKQFMIVQIIVMIIYIFLSSISFNAQDITKCILDKSLSENKKVEQPYLVKKENK